MSHSTICCTDIYKGFSIPVAKKKLSEYFYLHRGHSPYRTHIQKLHDIYIFSSFPVVLPNR